MLFFNVINMSFNAIRENKIPAKFLNLQYYKGLSAGDNYFSQCVDTSRVKLQIQGSQV